MLKRTVTLALTLAALGGLLGSCRASPSSGGTTMGMPAKAQRFYAVLLALPPFPSGAVNCPADSGVSYQITLYRGTAPVQEAVLSVTGCQGVTLSGANIRWAARDPEVWSELANALGVPESAVYPVAPQK